MVRFFYALARFFNDVNAVCGGPGPAGRRYARRSAYRTVRRSTRGRW